MSGFNTRVEYKGAVYNVQTQDKGPARPQIETLIYRSGALVTSRRQSYAAAVGKPGLKEAVERLMESQHKTVLGEIVEGRFA